MGMRQKIQDQMKEAMKAQDKVRLESLRYIWSEIKNAEIDAKMELDDQGIEAVISREVKKRKDAIEQMISTGRAELAEEEKTKLEVFMEFLPEQMGREEISELVNELMSELGESDFGKVMGQVMAKVKGKADGKMVQEVVREKLGNS